MAYFVVYTLVYTLIFVLITNAKDIILALKNAISSKDTKKTTDDATVEEHINAETPSDNGITGFFTFL